ncbi:hypothetical protein ACIQXM_15300 [Arthrobacter sp. NPDC097144]|uniref:hypothetical protein n=1 Tax=Arthrobacter sp. NPDC097144 TaxID=3363946 RepID=UPI00380F3237
MQNISEDLRVAAGPWPDAGAQTEDPAVNAALAVLGQLGDLPSTGHHAVYSALHDSLMAELTAEPPEER